MPWPGADFAQHLSYFHVHVSCRWVSVVKEMREVFARLEAQGYPRERQEVSPWTSGCSCHVAAGSVWVLGPWP